MTDIQPKKFYFDSVEGISKKQLNQHYRLYKGYINKLNEIWNILDENKIYPNPNPTFGQMRSLKLGETYALDGVKLHELYFDNLGGYNREPYGRILRLINREFGDYDKFYKKFRNIGLSMRGWVVLCMEPKDNRLHIYGSDAHDVGTVWKSFPLLVMDVYEHAYMIDFGINRKKYIKVFFDNINWKVVNNRLREYYEMTRDNIYRRLNINPGFNPNNPNIPGAPGVPRFPGLPLTSGIN